MHEMFRVMCTAFQCTMPSPNLRPCMSEVTSISLIVKLNFATQESCTCRQLLIILCFLFSLSLFIFRLYLILKEKFFVKCNHHLPSISDTTMKERKKPRSIDMLAAVCLATQAQSVGNGVHVTGKTLRMLYQISAYRIKRVQIIKVESYTYLYFCSIMMLCKD